MRFKKLTVSLLAATTLTLILAAWFASDRGKEWRDSLGPEPEKNAISGLIGQNGPVLVVKIDDTPFARPQVGIEEADLVYIEQVEGGLTRLAAVFSRTIPSLIGPVRSARITDIDLLSQYGYIAFAYSGAQTKLLPVIAAANWRDVGAQKLGPSFYFNDPTRTPPYAMMARAQDLMSSLQTQAIAIAPSRAMGWRFGRAPDSGTAISKVRVSWPASSYTASWSKEEQRWLLSNNGVENRAASGVHLGASTLVIQNVIITASEYRDKVGGVTPQSQVIGSGTGYILRDGQYFSARWIRENAESGTRWIDEQGRDIAFAPGQIWVALTDKAPDFTVTTPAQR